jgi:hypothetical protein
MLTTGVTRSAFQVRVGRQVCCAVCSGACGIKRICDAIGIHASPLSALIFFHTLPFLARLLCSDLVGNLNKREVKRQHATDAASRIALDLVLGGVAYAAWLLLAGGA